MMPHFSPMNVLTFATYSASVPCGDGRYLTEMLGSAAAAACMPSHADWLNDRSSMVPSSATMQPTNLADVLAGEEPDEAGGVVVDEGAELLELPHAPTTSVADTASAAVAHALFFTLPPLGRRHTAVSLDPSLGCSAGYSRWCRLGRGHAYR